MKQNKINANVEALKYEIENTMQLLERQKVAYYYNPVSIQINGSLQEITCNNHVNGRENCGQSFTMLQQYEHILRNNNFNCILYDGSVIKSNFLFENQKLISHNHLWWPAPYKFSQEFSEEHSPLFIYEDFITDNSWNDKISMRSPIRIDFDSGNDKEGHPALHMHTQHHETRIKVNKPICFNRFIKYILENFYPDKFIDFTHWHYDTFTYDEPKKNVNTHTTLVLK